MFLIRVGFVLVNIVCFTIINEGNIFIFFPGIAVFLFWTLALVLADAETRNGFADRYLLMNGHALDLVNAPKEDGD